MVQVKGFILLLILAPLLQRIVGEEEACNLLQHKASKAHAQKDCAFPALGMFSIDGYFWPSQPGDPNDKRTWCDVEGLDPPNYTCIPKPGDFSLSPITVPNLTWFEVQSGRWNSSINEQWTLAVTTALADPCVKAMMGNAGFFSFFQTNVNTVMEQVVRESDGKLKMKPWIGGAPALAPLMGGDVEGMPIKGYNIWESPDDMTVILTSDSPDISGLDLVRLLHETGVEKPPGSCTETYQLVAEKLNLWYVPKSEADACLQLRQMALLQNLVGTKYLLTYASRFLVVGVQTFPYVGWPIVDGAAFYNAKLGTQYVVGGVMNAKEEIESNGKSLRIVLIECTELPVFANSIRKSVQVPVWDAHTVGECLMEAAPSYNSTLEDLSDPDESNEFNILNNAAFHNCLMAWDNTTRFNTKFGEMPDGKLRYYDTSGYSNEDIDQLTCTGGRPAGKPALGRLVIDFEVGPVAQGFTSACTAQPICGGDNTPYCANSCPGGGSCGEAIPTSPCGVHGDMCQVAYGHAKSG